MIFHSYIQLCTWLLDLETNHKSISNIIFLQGHRMKTYGEEIRILREERDEESLRERDLVRNIIAIWKEIRNLRTTQKYNNTSHKIIIHKVKS